jgi:hypothetical protein
MRCAVDVAQNLRDRATQLQAQANQAALQNRMLALRVQLVAARAAVPRDFASVGALELQLQAAREAQAAGIAAGPPLPALEARELAELKEGLVRDLHAHCDALDRQQDFPALVEFGRLLEAVRSLEE